MKPYYKTENGELYNGDVLKTLKKLPDKSVNMCVTSPPYWQLRDYGYPEQWGLESTYQEYLEHLWQMMDEIWRVLKDDGTVWINLGDSYSGSCNGSWNAKPEHLGKQKKYNKDNNYDAKYLGQGTAKANCDIPKKSLCLIPHRFAIGCIDRGWILRNDIIWAKRNGMPESVRDRFSKKHEYFFFMVKKQKYYFDLDGIRDKTVTKEKRKERIIYDSSKGDETNKTNTFIPPNSKGKNPGDVSDFWDIPTKASKKKHYATYNFALIDKCIIGGCPKGGTIIDPFNGTGTTTLRAEQLGRKWIGIDGSKDYCKIAKASIQKERTQTKLF